MKKYSTEKLWIFFYYLLKILIGVALVLSILRQEWENMFFISIIFLLTFIPTLLKRKYRLYIPIEFDLFIVSFIFLSLFLGEIFGFYYKIWWWDLYLHTEAGFLLGITGFILVYILNEQKATQLRLKPIFTSLFAFTFAMTIGVCWEIIEFTADSIIGLNMQKSGLEDTMWDLIVDFVGALSISVIGYFWLKNKNTFYLFEKPFVNFLEENGLKFFKKKK